MKKILLLAGAALLSGMSASANIIVNGGFDSAIAIIEAKIVDPDSYTPNAIDNGWIKETASQWDAVAGVATRSLIANTTSAFGFAQIVSNPLDTTFDNGDTVTISFDYNFDGGNLGLNTVLYGITGTGGWAGSTGINLESPTTGPITALGYTYTPLDTLVVTTASGAQSYSSDVVLGAQYDYFAVGFWSDVDSGTGVTIDNVDLSPTIIPEPATLGLIASMGGCLLFIRRRLLI